MGGYGIGSAKKKGNLNKKTEKGNLTLKSSLQYWDWSFNDRPKKLYRFYIIAIGTVDDAVAISHVCGIRVRCVHLCGC